ncbi:MAG: D-3-phosphoglycerate dehydrogenase, partial [uncultured Microvirga sp.]
GRPGARPAHESDRLRPLPHARAGARSRCRKGGTRRPSGPRRRDHAAHAADREDEEHPLRRRAGADEVRRAHRQLRPWRARRRAGAAGRARLRPCGGRRLRRFCPGAGEREPALRAPECR